MMSNLSERFSNFEASLRQKCVQGHGRCWKGENSPKGSPRGKIGGECFAPWSGGVFLCARGCENATWTHFDASRFIFSWFQTFFRKIEILSAGVTSECLEERLFILGAHRCHFARLREDIYLRNDFKTYQKSIKQSTSKKHWQMLKHVSKHDPLEP